MDIEYPVTITAAEYEARSGEPLQTLVDTPNLSALDDMLERAHENVYNLIYEIGGREFKNRLIQNNIDTVRPSLRRALFCQLDYMLDSGGDYGATDGSSIDERGALQLTDPSILRKKTLAPKVEQILRGIRPDLLLPVSSDAPAGAGGAL